MAVRTNISHQEERDLKTPSDVEDAIRRRAYEFYEQRGYVDGHDMEDWLSAEQELRGEDRRKTAA